MFSVFLMLLLCFLILCTSFDAHARRVVGGGNIGRQTPSISQKRLNSSNYGNHHTESVKSSVISSEKLNKKSNWLAPVTGVLAGLGIAALFSNFGFPGGFFGIFSNIILTALASLIIVFLMRRFSIMFSKKFFGTNNSDSYEHASKYVGINNSQEFNNLHKEDYANNQQNYSFFKKI
ncbi:MAG: hypothetical protein IR526_03765 [Bordetella sp.]|nr:MAG: hypothetical protein IR526_03765 [Bordetella sp.]